MSWKFSLLHNQNELLSCVKRDSFAEPANVSPSPIMSVRNAQCRQWDLKRLPLSIIVFVRLLQLSAGIPVTSFSTYRSMICNNYQIGRVFTFMKCIGTVGEVQDTCLPRHGRPVCYLLVLAIADR